MCCSLMVTVRDISFPSHFWIVGYFAGSRLNFRVTITKGAEVPRSPFLPCVSLAGLGLRHLAGASRGVWKGQIRHRRKCGLLAVRVPCWGFRLGSCSQGLFSLTLVSCSFSSCLAQMCVYPLQLQLPHICSVLCHVTCTPFHTLVRFSIPCSPCVPERGCR